MEEIAEIKEKCRPLKRGDTFRCTGREAVPGRGQWKGEKKGGGLYLYEKGEEVGTCNKKKRNRPLTPKEETCPFFKKAEEKKT